MRRRRTHAARSLLTAGVLLTLVPPAVAAGAEGGETTTNRTSRDDERWGAQTDAPRALAESLYGYEAPAPRQIIQHKARLRAMARVQRLETMAAYGMSNARPTANPTPTGLYSPEWRRPGGRPYGWYTAQRPVIYVLR